MKKMKGVAAAAAAVTIGSSSPPYAGSGYQDPRIRFKHESLIQDYEELLKETEGKRKRLETMKQRRMTLMAEVRFLRRRFKFLTENQARNPNPEQQLQGAVINKSRKARKNNNNNSKGTSSGHDEAAPAPKFDLNRKGGRVYRAKDDSVAAASCINLNRQQQQKSSYSGREAAAMRNAGAMIPDVNVTKERMLFGKDVAAAAASGGGGRNNAPFFDLNQISTEEEELQTNGEMITTTTITTMRMEDPRIVVSTLRGGIMIDEQHNNNSDLKLLACRSVGNVPSRSGKRKISWQDPVALRV